VYAIVRREGTQHHRGKLLLCGREEAGEGEGGGVTPGNTHFRPLISTRGNTTSHRGPGQTTGA